LDGEGEDWFISINLAFQVSHDSTSGRVGHQIFRNSVTMVSINACAYTLRPCYQDLLLPRAIAFITDDFARFLFLTFAEL
jgi:hypothetical protein